MRAGILVCGGESTRFGDADKICTPLDETPLVRHVADRLEPILDEVVISCRRAQQESIETALEGYALPVTFAYDDQMDAGPLHGIGEGLEATTADWAVVVACDMPFVDPTFVRHLFDLAADHDAAIPRQGTGDWYQPLQAVYRVDAMRQAVNTAQAEGLDRPLDAVRKLDFVTVEGTELERVTDEWTFFNINTREDLATAAERLDEIDN